MARGSFSPFEIVLTVEERRELERRARCYTARYAEVVRARIVLLAARGLANVEVAARCDTSPQVVHRWRRRFFEQRLNGLEDRPRTGRPRVFSPLGKRRGQSLGLRTAGDHRRAAVALELRRAGQGAGRRRRWWPSSRPPRYGGRCGLTPSGRGSTGRGSSPRPAIRPQGGGGLGPLRPDLRGTAAGKTGVRDQLGREDQHPGPLPLPPHSAARQGPVDARRARIRPGRGAGLPGRLRRPPRSACSVEQSRPPGSSRSAGWSNRS